MLATPAAAGSLTALCFSADGRAADELTWSAMQAGARRVAAHLAGSIDRGEPVLLAVPTSPDFFDAFFGILEAGGVPVPVALPRTLNPSRLGPYQELLAGIARDAGARRLITVSRCVETLSASAGCGPAGAIVIAVDRIAGRPEDDWCPVPVSPDDLALLQYTSGSTSRPKGVALSHANILANTALIAEAIVTPESSGVSWLPLYHDMGLIGGALAALYSRTPTLLLPTPLFIKDPASWLRAIAAFQGTITLAPNFAFQHAVRSIADDQLEGVSLATLETALNGAEPVDVAAIEAFEARFAAWGLRRGTVRPVYGLAEASLAVTFSDPGELIVDRVDAEALEQAGRARPADPAARARSFVSVGRPLPTQQLSVVNERDEPLGEREVGEVIVRGPSVMRGYYRDAEASDRALRGGWLHTGDLGYLAGGRLFLTGRSRDLIIRYGRNYYPSDIEAVVSRTEGLGRGAAAVFAVNGDQDVRIVVVAETRVRRDPDLAALARAIRERVHDAFLFGPDDVRLVPPGAIPRTTSGKIRREACRQLYLAGELPDPPGSSSV